MGKICAAPTAGSCGIIPAVVISLEEALNLPKKDVLDALLTASGIGAVIPKTQLLRAEGGCQAECGVAAAHGLMCSCTDERRHKTSVH